MGNLSNNIEYFNISPLFRVKSCTLYKYNQDTQAYELVNTINNTNPEKVGINVYLYHISICQAI
jgi:hypothetical protein